MCRKKTGRQLELNVYWVMEFCKFSFLKNIFQVVCIKHVSNKKIFKHTYTILSRRL